MRKFLLFILICFSVCFLTGCEQSEDQQKEADLHFDDTYYSIALPYVEGVGGHYVVEGAGNVPINQIDISLMDLSTTYFKTNNSFYQEGQYLSFDELKDLLRMERLNQAPSIDVDGVSLTPTYITHIHEQNYLSSNHKLKGISLALVLNPYQKINETDYYEADVNQVIQFGKEKAKDLVSYLREKEELQDVRILIGLYVCGNPNMMDSGSFQYLGITRSDQIQFDAIDYQYHYLSSSYVMDHDFNHYNSFLNFEKELKLIKDGLFVSGQGLYIDRQLSSLNVTIHSSYLSRSEVLMLGQVVGDQLIQLFEPSIYIHTKIVVNDEVKAFVTKERNSLRVHFYVL